MLREAASLSKYWRLLFHARVHLALADRIASGQLMAADVARRIERWALRPSTKSAVLRGEDLLLPPVTDASVYEEFVAVFLELKYFAPALLPSYFPTLDDMCGSRQSSARIFITAALYEQTELPVRPKMSKTRPKGTKQRSKPASSIRSSSCPLKQSERHYCRIMERADRSRARGNLVRRRCCVGGRRRWSAELARGRQRSPA